MAKTLVKALNRDFLLANNLNHIHKNIGVLKGMVDIGRVALHGVVHDNNHWVVRFGIED